MIDLEGRRNPRPFDSDRPACSAACFHEGPSCRSRDRRALHQRKGRGGQQAEDSGEKKRRHISLQLIARCKGRQADTQPMGRKELELREGRSHPPSRPVALPQIF